LPRPRFPTGSTLLKGSFKYSFLADANLEASSSILGNLRSPPEPFELIVLVDISVEFYIFFAKSL
jgi:hypothetical protein